VSDRGDAVRLEELDLCPTVKPGISRFVGLPRGAEVVGLDDLDWVGTGSFEAVNLMLGCSAVSDFCISALLRSLVIVVFTAFVNAL